MDIRLNLLKEISYGNFRINGDTQDQICDLQENLQQIEKLKNKDMRILLDKIVRTYGGKVVNK